MEINTIVHYTYYSACMQSLYAGVLFCYTNIQLSTTIRGDNNKIAIFSPLNSKLIFCPKHGRSPNVCAVYVFLCSAEI